MHIISVIGLVLLPLVSFSAILQTPYFQLASQNQLNVTLSFSQFLGVCLSVTIVVIAAWWFLTRETNVKVKTRRNATKLVM
jgi:hypothetical protein